MNSKQRMYARSRGKKTDRIPFLPTILEHSAGVIGRTPSEAAVDAQLLENSHIAAYNAYGHDALTIGIDIYNIEAEALGCKVKYHEDNSIPGIISHPLADAFDTVHFTYKPGIGRTGIVLDAAASVLNRLGDEIGVSVPICGPFSISAELYGYENLVNDCIDGEDRARELMSAVLEFQKCYSSEIIKRGLGIVIFESWGAPPLVSPGIYAEYVAPYEKELIGYIKSKGLAAAPLVIGGDTSAILDDMLDTGTTLLVADYKVEMDKYLKKASEKNIMLRCNIDPKLVESGPVDAIIGSLAGILDKVKGYERFVLGTGVIPYGTPSHNLLAIKAYLENI